MPWRTVPTPALVLDLDVLERNVASMATRAATLGVVLRPHFKTHKCIEVLTMQRRAGAVGVTVSTLDEARVVVDAGHDDVTWAFPLILGRLDEACALARRATLRFVVDSPEAVDALCRAESSFHVWIKVDTGYGRAGIEPSDPRLLSLARRIDTAPNLTLDGLLSHCGHAYDASSPAAIVAIAEADRIAMVSAASSLRHAGIRVPSVSVGSTPSMMLVERLDGVDEARPGNYVFFDHVQRRLGACALSDCALTVSTSVVSSRSHHAIVDAGALALSKDPGVNLGASPVATMGDVLRDDGTLEPDQRLVSLSQEHGRLNASCPVGTRLRILPNHACLTAACFDHYVVVRGTRVVDRWRIHRQR